MSRGGSRYGAGRPGWRRKIEQCLRLDVRQLARAGLLRSGSWRRWRWTNSYTGEETGSVGIRYSEGRVVLDYQTDGTPASVSISLTNTPCHYGGARPWFVCPRCGQRCGIVAYGGRGWACRHCLNLAYASEAEDATGRLWRKQWRLEARLGEDWRRPKGMHHSTHSRIVRQLCDIERRKDDLLVVAMSRFIGWR